MHEMCSMIEDLAKMIKNFEVTLGMKRNETESILLNLANL
jgi:hypothetical protein